MSLFMVIHTIFAFIFIYLFHTFFSRVVKPFFMYNQKNLQSMRDESGHVNVGHLHILPRRKMFCKKKDRDLLRTELQSSIVNHCF